MSVRAFLSAALLGAGLLSGACGGAGRALVQPLRPLRPDSLWANGEEREADLVELALDLRLDPASGSVSGTATQLLRSLRLGVQELRLHAVGLDVERVVDGSGRALPFRTQEPHLLVGLAEPLDPGQEVRLEVTYRARPRQGLHFERIAHGDGAEDPLVWTLGQFENHRHWIPTWDHPSDRTRFEGRFTVGDGLEVLSNGELISVLDLPSGERTFHWRLEREIPTYLIAVAAGRFERYADRAGEVELEYVVPRGTGLEAALRAFGETPRMLAFFEELLGMPYPFSRYAQVVVPGYPWSGMENATLTMIAGHVLGDEATVADLEGDPRLIVAHELAHHWFGNLVTCRGWSDLWLHEGWASYLELLYQEEVEGTASFRLWLERYRHGYLSAGERTRHPLALDWFTQSPEVQRANHVYTKGPWVLYMLNCALDNDAFWRGARAFLERHADGLVTTDDLVRAFFDTSGHNVEGWIEQWVEAGGHPVYEVEFVERRAEEWRDAVGPGAGGDGAPEPEDGLLLRVRQVQVTDGWVPLFDLPVAVDLHYADGRSERFRIRVDEAEEIFRLPLEGELVDLVFESECALLCELRLDKDVQWWIRQLEREDPPAQWRALEGLEPLLPSSRAAREALRGVMLGSGHALLRQRAAALAGHPDGVEDLLRAVLEDPSPHVRRQAATTLSGQRLDAGQRERLREHLAFERSPATRAILTSLLGEQGR